MITNASPPRWLPKGCLRNLGRRSVQVGGPRATKSFPPKSVPEVFIKMTLLVREQKQSAPPAGSSTSIGVFIKAPRTGSSKTRLCPPLELHESAALSRCFLQDTVENISTVSLEKEGVIGVAVYSPVGSEQDFQELLPNDFLLIPQHGESLGDRLHNATEDLFSGGFDSV